MLFSNNSEFPIGLDISDLSLKFVQLKKKSDKIKIQALGRVELGKGVIENGEIKNEEEVIKKLKELIGRPKFGFASSNEVVACLPDTKTFIKLIEVENTFNKLSDIIPFEIEKHVPMMTKEIYFDWQIIEARTDKYLILFGASPQTIVNQYISVISRAGFSVIGLEIESTAICRCLLTEENPKFKNQAGKNYAIIDIGARRASLTIYAKNSVVSSVSIPISGDAITEKISKHLEIKHDQAEKAKIICGLDKGKAQGIIHEILIDMLNELNKKIKEILEFYADHYSELGPIDSAIICGGGANIKDIDAYISQYNSIKASQGNIFVNLGENLESCQHEFTEIHKLHTVAEDGKQLQNLSLKQNSSLTYATAIGLALRGIFSR